MSKLVDIKGYWNMSGGYDFNDNDMWEGKLLLEDENEYKKMSNASNPYGDGTACEQIVEILRKKLDK